MSQADVTTSADLAATINIPVKTIQNINVAVSQNNAVDNDVIGPSFKQSMIIDHEQHDEHFDNDGSKMNVMDSEIIDDVQSEFPSSSCSAAEADSESGEGTDRPHHQLKLKQFAQESTPVSNKSAAINLSSSPTPKRSQRSQ